MSNRETLKKARNLIVQNILAGKRPGPDEMLLMSEPYQKVWTDHDNQTTSPDDLPDWASVLDPPRP